MDDFPIAIIGAGFSGLGMAIQLERAGIRSYTIYEAADDVGGTWRDNTYPGCACDVPSHLYSFSFERNPRWSRAYSPQPEIWDYLKHCVKKYGLGPRIRFGTLIVRAEWDERAGEWTLETQKGEVTRARVVVAGLGPLRVPSIAKLPGIERFAGTTFHSARWNHDYDLRGKNVAVVGTGASAIQFVPRIAPDVARLHLFQRTAPWVMPKLDRPYEEREKDRLARSPLRERALRTAIYSLSEMLALGFVVDPRLLRIFELQGKKHLREMVKDPALRERLTPHYRLGCKRILFSNDYYPALGRENVELVTDAIREVTEHGIVTKDGRERKVDAIIYGTGFEVSKFLSPMEVRGLGGREMNEEWTSGAEAYLGLAVSGYPNFFMMLGPNTGLGHTSIVFMIEAQVHYVLEQIKAMRARRVKSLDVVPAVQREFNERLQARMAGNVWQTGCKSWYLDENGKNFTIWPGFTVEYWLRTRRPDRRAWREVPA